MNARFLHSIVSSSALFTLATLFVGCGPPIADSSDESVRLGYLDEFCNDDFDCQKPLTCERNACTQEDTPGTISCADMCERLVNGCGRSEGNCEGSCRETIKGWSAEAIDIFGDCTLGNTTPQLDCEEAVKDSAPSFCYLQIPLDSGRQQRCDTFVEQAREYASGSSDDQLKSLRQSCYILARTRSAEDWSVTDECDETGQSFTPSEVINCYNNKFDLSSPLNADSSP